jgi:hypothetical protein
MMFLVDVEAYFEHVQIIRCDIKPGPVGRPRDRENTQFLKNLMGTFLGPVVKTPGCLI